MKRRHKKRPSRAGALPAAILLFVLLWAGTGRFSPFSSAPMPDLPASDEPEGLVWESESVFFQECDLPEYVPPQQAETPVYDIAGKSGNYESRGTVYFKNQTKYTIDMPSLLKKESPVSLGTEGVQVLIMHTHGTEAYEPSPDHRYTASGDHRTTDSTCNMLAVGQVICDILNARGISAVHSTTLNDYPAYNGAYNRALKDINSYINQYPSVQLVIDVHRDAIGTAGNYYKTSAEVDGTQTAQLMFVTGTDAGGLDHPHWRDNLAFQAQLHDRINSLYPGLMRPISIRTSRFNQHIRTGSMLVEVGACGNTLEEAEAAAAIFASELANTLTE